MQLEAEGHRILKLNIGNPAPFGFEAPDGDRCQDVIAQPAAARRATATRKGLLVGTARASCSTTRPAASTGVDVEDVYLGNGVSELIVMAMQALLDDGDEVLVPGARLPAVDGRGLALPAARPCTTAATSRRTGCPTSRTSSAKVTDRTKALVIINPNNPTGAVYARDVLAGLVDVARRHDLLVLSDEIYDQILYDGADARRDRGARPRPAVPDVQRPVEGVPRGRLPGRLDGRVAARRRTRAATSRGWTCSPTCGCAPTCRPSTRSQPRSAAGRASTTWCCPAAACSSSATRACELLTRSRA